jgi:hypothetical protein
MVAEVATAQALWFPSSPVPRSACRAVAGPVPWLCLLRVAQTQAWVALAVAAGSAPEAAPAADYTAPRPERGVKGVAAALRLPRVEAFRHSPVPEARVTERPHRPCRVSP